ncbi:hypothetical protein JCM3765_001920 [Sporobolomyces pararoseus]
MKSDIYASLIYLVVFTALAVWDWMILLPLEWRYIYRAKWSPLKVLYLFNRYGVLVLTSICTALIMSRVPQHICKRTAWIETFTLVYAMLITDAILMLRVYAVYDRSRTAAVSLGVLLAFEVSALIVAGAQTRPLILPPAITDYLVFPGCLAGQTSDRHGKGILWLLSGAPLIVNTVLLSATFYRNWKMKQTTGRTVPIMQRLLRGGVQYYAAILVFNLLNCYFWLQSNPVMRSFNICANVVVSSIASCRLVLSLFDGLESPKATGAL